MKTAKKLCCVASSLLFFACSSDSSPPSTPPPASGGTSGATGGANSGGTPSGGAGASVSAGSGGTQNTGGDGDSGGSQLDGGGSSTGGSGATGGAQNSGGSIPSGGSHNTGGSPSGGTENTGGTQPSGGAENTGGVQTGGTENTGGADTSVQCDDTSTASGTLDNQYDPAVIPVAGKDKDYVAAPNWWNIYNGQSVSYNGLSFKVNDPQNAASGSDNNPVGYPTMFIGSYSGNGGKGSNLPKQVSAIQSVRTIFRTNALDRDTSQFNAAYDVWFTEGGSPLSGMQYSPGRGGAYLMVWLYKPAARQPRGGNCGDDGCTPEVSGHTVEGITPSTWDVWIDDESDPLCISYVSTTPVDSMSFDLNKFIQDAVTNDYGIKSSMYLSVVFAGFEIWGDGNGLEVKQYCAQVD